MTYRESIRRLALRAHFIGPPLLLLSTLLYVSGTGRNLDGFSSYVEGAVGVWALMFFMPIFLTVAELIGRHHVKHGVATAVIGTVGAAGGVFAMGYRVVVGSLEKSGLTPEIVEAHLSERDSHWELLAMAPATVAFPVTSIVVGIGLLRLRDRLGHPSFVAPALIAAGVAFLVAQGTEASWALDTLYPASAALMAIGYGTVGRHLMPPRNAVVDASPRMAPARS